MSHFQALFTTKSSSTNRCSKKPHRLYSTDQITPLTISACGLFDEGINSRCDGAFVTQVPGDPSLVLSRRSADEGRVVDEAVLRRVTLGLQGTEKGLLGTQDLHCGGGALRQ